jgi:hypothetical protein
MIRDMGFEVSIAGAELNESLNQSDQPLATS